MHNRDGYSGEFLNLWFHVYLILLCHDLLYFLYYILIIQLGSDKSY